MTSRPDRYRRLSTFAMVGLVALVVGSLTVLGLTRMSTVPVAAGRTDPSELFDRPSLLFEDPGILGTAVELSVADVVRQCMETKGFPFGGLPLVEPIDGMVQPEDHGYAIATGPVPDHTIGGFASAEGEAFERALYGRPLRDFQYGDVVGGCAQVGRDRLDESVALLADLPYSIPHLETDVRSDSRYQAGVDRWAECMTERGHRYTSPLQPMAELREQLSTSRGSDPFSLIELEVQVAADDRACRARTIDAVLDELAAEYGKRFVERNRAQLMILIPVPDDSGDIGGLGTGDVQVTLVWESGVDLDLAVREPRGDVVFYDARVSPSGGRLDRDANYPCESVEPRPAENVFWPTNSAPAGSYTAIVTYQTGCADLGPIRYQLIIRTGGVIREAVDGVIGYGEEIALEFSWEE